MTDDVLFFGWRYNPLAKNDEEAFRPIIFREHHGKIQHLHSKWKLKPHEHWLGLDELRERYPLKE